MITKKLKSRRKVAMKAYRIRDDYVAAHNEPQAIGTWAANFDVDPKTAGVVEEVNPNEVVVHFEQQDGTFQPGTLTEIMPLDGNPEVVIDGDVD